MKTAIRGLSKIVLDGLQAANSIISTAFILATGTISEAYTFTCNKAGDAQAGIKEARKHGEFESLESLIRRLQID
ncbi:hypothetical protein BELL_0203g00080 [Botrytis elliptica]|uniref:Uncharacterized protein n=1 Tax=Botrytis elliptica TaxID=278938 RepID=A0A4Z1JWJ0_9HELO|nr:hypothetical protein BELL_0203g00080 [Botrytis elliptica]